MYVNLLTIYNSLIFKQYKNKDISKYHVSNIKYFSFKYIFQTNTIFYVIAIKKVYTVILISIKFSDTNTKDFQDFYWFVKPYLWVIYF